MADIVVKKRITLEFLGDDYKDGFLTCQSIPMNDYDKIIKNVEGRKGEGAALKLIRDIVTERLIDGEIPQDGKSVKVTKENCGQLPMEVFTEAFQQLTGQISPK